jgi:hypothetical protein
MSLLAGPHLLPKPNNALPSRWPLADNPQQVVELQRYMVFEGKPGSTAWAVLGEAREVLERARSTIHEKAEVGKGIGLVVLP